MGICAPLERGSAVGGLGFIFGLFNGQDLGSKGGQVVGLLGRVERVLGPVIHAIAMRLMLPNLISDFYAPSPWVSHHWQRQFGVC